MLKPSLVAIAIALVLPVLSCGAKKAEEASAVEAAIQAAAQTAVLESGTRELRCGCKIDGINKCGNYVADGDDWLEISNPSDHDLDIMEWCKVPAEIHVMGEVAGVRTGPEIKVSTLLVDQ